MSDDGTVAALQAAAAQAIAEIGRIQSALTLSKDRTQQTKDILNRGFSGSNRDEIASALAALTAVDEIIDQAIEATILSVEQLGDYAGSI